MEIMPATEALLEPRRREPGVAQEGPPETEDVADRRPLSVCSGGGGLLPEGGVSCCAARVCRPGAALRLAARRARRSRCALKARRWPSSFARCSGSRMPSVLRSSSSESRTSAGPSTSSLLKGTPMPAPSRPSTQSPTSSADHTTQSRLKSSSSSSLPALRAGSSRPSEMEPCSMGTAAEQLPAAPAHSEEGCVAPGPSGGGARACMGGWAGAANWAGACGWAGTLGGTGFCSWASARREAEACMAPGLCSWPCTCSTCCCCIG
mmetsp:Transcript_7404/g.22958  ORF Transcript_7404/g.22958 Transcript_7404/m.22958 type:complete len:264 (+) Transcript_7404:1147-1938(+)